MTFFTEGRYLVATPSVRLLLEPDYEAKMDEQALMGEELEVLEASGEFSHVRVKYSGKTGWLASASQKLNALDGSYPTPTHRVRIPRAVTFRKPDAEMETMVVLPLNAHIALGERQWCGNDEFARVMGLSGNMEAWVRTSMLMPICKGYESDFVAVQETLINFPYVWGARDTTLGLDCSRLLGESLRATGKNYCPGDTREQRSSRMLGNQIYGTDNLQRGDLVFSKGHVVTMIDRTLCIHATDLVPYHRVLVQELEEVVHERGQAGKGPITAIRRFKGYTHSKLRSLVA